MLEVICERVSSFVRSDMPYLCGLFADRLLVNLVYKKHSFLLNRLKFIFLFRSLFSLISLITVNYQAFDSSASGKPTLGIFLIASPPG